MTVEMFAKRKNIPLTGIEIQLDHAKIYLKDCEECMDIDSTRKGKIDRIESHITLHGDELTDSQRQDLFKIANMCPVHKTLLTQSVVVTTLADNAE
eukprot:m.139374 g.139374  ORF g.139374 m.139374 type:complete len:96 (+) comp30051_c0_seq2:382-669(+)